MKNELIETLKMVKNITYMKTILLNMNNQDLSNLIDMLEFTDEDTKSRWLTTYNDLMNWKMK